MRGVGRWYGKNIEDFMSQKDSNYCHTVVCNIILVLYGGIAIASLLYKDFEVLKAQVSLI